jgi:3-dehydroquinate synthetase
MWHSSPLGEGHTTTRNMKKTRLAERTFHVNVPAGPGYDVVHRPGLLPDYGLLCRDIIPDVESKLIVLTDDRVDRLYGDQLRESFQRANLSPEFICIAPGETSKSLKTFEELLEDLAARRMDRRGLLVNFGGGVICDLGGFVASSYMRGIAYANFSTSLIGQLDASIGGKVAVNTTRAKNLIGAFHHPLHVAGDACVLETLSKRDMRSGIAEAIKVGDHRQPRVVRIARIQSDGAASCGSRGRDGCRRARFEREDGSRDKRSVRR